MNQHMIDFPAPFQGKEHLKETSLNIDMRTYTNTQLLNFIIGSEGYNVLFSVGQSLNQLAHKNIYDLMKIRGIGPGKALRIMATIELGRRRQSEAIQDMAIVRQSRDIFNYFSPLISDLPHEEFWLLFLRRNNTVIGSTRIGTGGVGGVVVDSKLVFRSAIEHRACCVILCHNHPSGSLKPSSHDIGITKRLIEAGKALDILVTDHVIIGGSSYFSFADEGMM